MGREVRRVPPDFDHPPGEVWSGFLLPESLHEDKCVSCDGTGYSRFARHQKDRWYGYVPFDPSETGSTPLTYETPAVRAFAERNIAHAPGYYGRGEYAIVREAVRLCGIWNGMWSHHLHQDDVDALIKADRLWDFTHTLAGGKGWQPIEPTPVVTAGQVNTWSLRGFGHDAINCSVVVRAACDRAGQAINCADCDGHGSIERYPDQRAEAEEWEPTDPPEGDGWQLWETVSEGSPISPVFATAEETALKFVNDGWAPSFVATPETGFIDGVNFIGSRDGA